MVEIFITNQNLSLVRISSFGKEYYRAPAGVSPIFGATLPGSSELISWTEKSDDQKNGLKYMLEVLFMGKNVWALLRPFYTSKKNTS